MIWDKLKNWSIVLLFIISLVFGYLLFKKKESDTIKVPVVIEVPIQGKIGTFPPLEFPKPKKEKPKPELVEEFEQSDKDKRDSLYADAVTERTYEEIFKDSVQAIKIKTVVQGRLLKQEPSYEIYPDTIPYETEVEVKIPKRTKLYGSLALGLPLLTDQGQEPVVEGGLLLIPKNDKMGYKATVNTAGYVLGGVVIKF